MRTPSEIVAKWHALGVDIRLDLNTVLDPANDDAPQWLRLGQGWEYLPCPFRLEIQKHYQEVVRYLRDEVCQFLHWSKK